MKNSIISDVVILKKDSVKKNNRCISAGTFGFIVTDRHLKNSNISPDYHKELMQDCLQAKSKGYLFIDFGVYGFMSVRPDCVY
jgi:hypothetical protein